ncbi:MAG: ABC transporter substrate-binding protein [Bacillota bacterium]|nr:ABC transporter substrate-binding protein [Bacillota bacterium]
MTTNRKRYTILFSLLTVLLLFTACTDTKSIEGISSYSNWSDVIEAGSNKEVTILMWGGNESINLYMDQFVSDKVEELYGIKLKRVPMNAPDYLTKLINEKKSGSETGTADLLWINAENFLTAKTGGLLSGPFTSILPNLNTYYDLESDDMSYDSGIAIDGYEAIWGRAQLVFSHDSASLPEPPMNYRALMDWAKENPGKFTFPKIPDDFVGTAFFRNAFYELTGEKEIFQTDMTETEFKSLAQPVIAYFNELSPYLWNKGESYPASQAQLDELFKNGEIEMTMGFEMGKTAGLIASKVYPETVDTFVFDTGTLGNSHYLAIPFNSPEQAAALLVIDYLQSPEAQLEKMKSEVWGDMPAFDVNRLSEAQKNELASMENSPGSLSIDELTGNRLPEMKSQYIQWIKKIWTEDVIKTD